MKKVLTIIVLFLSTFLYGQKTFTFDGTKSVIMMEAKAIINLENKKLIISMMLPGGNDGEQKVDLQKGDEILYINGKKVTEIAELRKLYEDVKAGGEVKLGVNRKENKFFVTFKKQDSSAGGSKIIRMGGDGKGMKVGGSGAIMMGPDGKVRDSKGKEISKEKSDEIKKAMETKFKSGKTEIYQK